MNLMAQLPPAPLVGRADDVRLIRSVLDAAADGRGSTLILAGPGGIGKTRLAAEAPALARARGFVVAAGRANPVESGIPYSLFSDAFLPTLRRMDAATRTALTRGVAELAYLLPVLAEGEAPPAPASGADAPDFKGRLLWNFTEVVRRLSTRAPLLVVLEDLQWADASSLELLHFMARGTTDEAVALVCTWNTDVAEAQAGLRTLERSLVSLGAARVHALEPLDFEATEELIARRFEVDPRWSAGSRLCYTAGRAGTRSSSRRS